MSCVGEFLACCKKGFAGWKARSVIDDETASDLLRRRYGMQPSRKLGELDRRPPVFEAQLVQCLRDQWLSLGRVDPDAIDAVVYEKEGVAALGEHFPQRGNNRLYYRAIAARRHV